ncbi:MAG TPA: type IV conjugative transfer system protein TraL [Aquifex aeolicus]|nr:type IV conjugative transfer system protein TraL [Aquifex aeolicus]
MEKEVYIIPKYLDDDYKALGLIPIDVILIFVFAFLPFLWILGHIKSFIIATTVSLVYYRYVKKKGRGYYKFLLFKIGFIEIEGTCPPTEKEVRV